jgi:hypothetical protein
MQNAKVHTALLLSIVYLVGLSLQVAPAMAQWLVGNGEAPIERQCPLKDQNTTSDFAFNQAASKADNGTEVSIFIPCLSAQENVSSYQGKPFMLKALSLFMPLLQQYQSPYLSRDPFPPKIG